MNKIKSILAGALLWAAPAFAQTPEPAAEQTKPILIYGATVHQGNGEVIKNAFILIDKGVITSIGDASNVRLDKTGRDYYDFSGKHIYPGFILANSTLGLAEIDAVRATRDYREVGAITPNVRSIVAYNAESKVTATVRTNGILMAQITPRGGLLSGTSSIVELDAWNWEDAAFKLDDGLHMNWPSRFYYSGWWAEPGGMVANENYDETITELNRIFEEAQVYAAGTPALTDLKKEALKGLFDGQKTLYIHADGAKEMIQAVRFAKSHGVQKVVLVGAAESYKIIDFLKEESIPVILQRVHELPSAADEDIDLPFRLPAMLHEAGILVAINYAGDMERMGSRNLPFTAGTAAGYGMTKEEALQLITLNVAKIMGIDQYVGSLEVGKYATFFVSEGDALDMRGNQVTDAWIQGKKLDLSNHQKALYERYKKKLGL